LRSQLNSPSSPVTAAGYAPHGALAHLRHHPQATGPFPSSTEAIDRDLTYNSRLQPVTIKVSDVTITGGRGGSTTYTTAFQLTYDFGLGSANNGNVLSIAHSLNPDRTQSFTYDQLNRIQSAQTQATTGDYCWGQTFSYDPWGNLLTIGAVTGYGACTQQLLSVTATTQNRISGFSYDAAGNMTSYPGYGSYTYDAENRMLTAGGVTYTYHGDGKRVMKSNGTLYWHGGGPDTLLETDLAGTPLDEYVFFNGQRVARRTASGTVYYFFSDHLGSSRIVTDSAGTVVEDSDFYPFGGERVVTDTLNNNYKFTGQERDPESGLDYFIARHYAFTLARFLQPDPVKITPGRKRDPQQLNLYGYVRNNPLNLIDPDGEILQISGGLEEAKKQLCSLIGGDCSRIIYDSNTNTLIVNLAGIDLSANEGASLVDQLANSSNVYDLSLGATAQTAAGPKPLTGDDVILNLDNRPDDRYQNGKGPENLPAAGVDAQIGINPSLARYKDSNGRPVLLSSLIFHELAEAYARVDGDKAYWGFSRLFIADGRSVVMGVPEPGAHEIAGAREQRQRSQNPILRLFGFAGDHLVRDPH